MLLSLYLQADKYNSSFTPEALALRASVWLQQEIFFFNLLNANSSAWLLSLLTPFTCINWRQDHEEVGWCPSRKRIWNGFLFAVNFDNFFLSKLHLSFCVADFCLSVSVYVWLASSYLDVLSKETAQLYVSVLLETINGVLIYLTMYIKTIHVTLWFIADTSLSLTFFQQSARPTVLSLPPLSPDDITAALKTKLWTDQRRLQEQQWHLLVQACLGCPCPLYLATAYSESKLWTSYSPQASLSLPASLEGLYLSMLARLERELGKQLVKRVASLICISRWGVTEQVGNTFN